MELREAVIMRQHYRRELAASLRRYRWLKAGGGDPDHSYTDADEVVSQDAERATFLRQQLDRVSRWLLVLERNPGAVGRFLLAAHRANAGHAFRFEDAVWKVVGLGWPDTFDSPGEPSMVKVAAIPVEVSA